MFQSGQSVGIKACQDAFVSPASAFGCWISVLYYQCGSTNPSSFAVIQAGSCSQTEPHVINLLACRYLATLRCKLETKLPLWRETRQSDRFWRVAHQSFAQDFASKSHRRSLLATAPKLSPRRCEIEFGEKGTRFPKTPIVTPAMIRTDSSSGVPIYVNPR